MVRSLSFIHLFLILTISYIGGVLLFREMPMTAVEKLISFYDARVVIGQEASFYKPIAITVLFFVVAFVLSIFRHLRFIVPVIGAIKCVFFGLASAYLLHVGFKMISYTLWWFPLQFVLCFLFLAFCLSLSPPFFIKEVRGKRLNEKTLLAFIVLTAIFTTVEMLIFYKVLF